MSPQHEITLTDDVCELRFELPLYNFEVRFLQEIIDQKRIEAANTNSGNIGMKSV